MPWLPAVPYGQPLRRAAPSGGDAGGGDLDFPAGAAASGAAEHRFCKSGWVESRALRRQSIRSLAVGPSEVKRRKVVVQSVEVG